MGRKKKRSEIDNEPGERPPLLLLSDITRRLRNLKPLYSIAYIVGGVVTEGYTWRDIDIVLNDPRDYRQIKKVLGPLSDRVDFMIQSKEPPAPFFIKITGEETRSPELFSEIKSKAKRIPKYEYAGPDIYKNGFPSKKSNPRKTLRGVYRNKRRRKN